MNIPALVVIAFNRPKSLIRLLNSIGSAQYPPNNVSLIISIDNEEDNLDVLEIANNFVWDYGDKHVNYESEHLGLKRHVIKCMGLVFKYENIILLEDDLFVSGDFYNYARQALNHSADNSNIAGISLYKHQMNVHTSRNFYPIEDGYDNWYFQFASSWGQVWSFEHIRGFMQWYKQDFDINQSKEIPAYVRNWSEKSWLKYFIAYVILENKFYIYPKISLSTNFGDKGTHIDEAETYYQVPLLNTVDKKYTFSSLKQSNSVYDAFFENVKLKTFLKLKNDDVTIDLYGYKTQYNTRYLLTSKTINFKICRKYTKSLKPLDLNIINNLEGKDIFLYDLKHVAPNPYKLNHFQALAYNYKIISLKDSIRMTKRLVYVRIIEIFSK